MNKLLKVGELMHGDASKE
jgi:hypothetical protein